MDAVILYVDCSDPKWKASYMKHTVTHMQASRFRDWGTLPFLLRGIAKYMPFIEKVFLVVSSESQVPIWVDRTQVNIVLHKDIIPQQYLPTFNSCVIETHVPYIKGLSEEFIYFNDDMFPISPCTPELFFNDGRPQDYFQEKRQPELPLGIYNKQCYNSTAWVREVLGIEQSDMYLKPEHWPHPMRKSLCLEILEKQATKYAAQVSRLRTWGNVNQYLFLDYAYLKGDADNVQIPFCYVSPDKQSLQGIVDAILNSEKKVICVNDSGLSDSMYNDYRKAVKKAFMQKLPERCKYESPGMAGELIISMTSYPARIGGVASVWQTILSQKVDIPFHCVLTLAEDEFPDRALPSDLQELSDSRQIEIIWYPRNIRSHKKIIPVLKKYPDAEIITVDDDILREEGWLQGLIDDHRKYPEDIITCLLTSFLDGEGVWRRVTGYIMAHAHGKNHIPGLVSNFIRFGSGSGTYFPAHTFVDDRFFDEDLMMNISPTSDESWMYLFAVLAGKTIRQSSKIYDESAHNVPGSQHLPTALYKTNKLKYREIWNNIFEVFPEFRKKINVLRRKVVVSLTSYPERFAELSSVIGSLLSQTMKPSKIVLCLAKGDESLLPEEILEHVEVLVAEEDLRPHNKYFWAMQKYQDYAIITVDDDIIYAPTMIETLMRGYWSHPDCVISRRVHRIIRRGGQTLPYEQWEKKCKIITEPSLELLATGVGGVLYPPNILNLNKSYLEIIRSSITADDLCLKYIEAQKEIKVLFVPDRKDTPLLGKIQDKALYKENVFNGGNDKIISALGI